jgi:hypothetical protein
MTSETATNSCICVLEVPRSFADFSECRSYGNTCAAIGTKLSSAITNADRIGG